MKFHLYGNIPVSWRNDLQTRWISSEMVYEATAVGGGGSGGRAGDQSGPMSGTSSPKSRVKFLCSHGGKIMPRPPDGHLKYVGGETRIVALPRDINFSELMKKLNVEFEGDMVLKYQVIPEDLDVLVSVINDEDLKYMLEEYDRHENEGPAKLRIFLFPTNPVGTDNQTGSMEPHAVEKVYVDAINGTFPIGRNSRLPPVRASRPIFSVSACNSPQGTSPENKNVDFIFREPFIMNGHHSSKRLVHKVHSSPSLSSLNSNCQSSKLSNHQSCQQHHHHGYLHQLQYPYDYQPSRLLTDSHWPGLPLSSGHPDFGRTPVSTTVSKCYSYRHNIGNANTNMYGYYNEQSHHGHRS